MNQEQEIIQVDEKEQRLYEIEVKMQEIEVAIEKIETSEEEETEETILQYQKLQEQYEELRAEKKQLLKGEKTAWDKVPVWMVIYAIIQLILLMPYLSYYIWMTFGDWIISLFKDSFNNLATSGSKFLFNTVLLLTIYSLPLIDFLLTWTLHVNVVKKEFDKKVFKWIWIIQTLLTIGLGIYLFFGVIKGNII